MKTLGKKFVRSKGFNLAIITAALIIFFQIMNKNFLGFDNIRGIMIACSLSGTITIGMACLMMSGSIDLAAGSEACMGALLVAMFMQAGMPWPVALLLSILYGALAGLFNAFLSNVLGFIPFIATIGMQSIHKAIALILVGGQNVAVPESQATFTRLGVTNLWIFPLPFILMIVLMVVYGVIISRTRFGRQMMLCGGNPNAARLAGINPKKITTIMFVNCGAVAAFAGAVLTARMRSASPYGITGAEMNGMTAAIIGGVSFMGGGSSGMGVLLIGLVLLNVFQNGIVTINLNSYWQVVSTGGLLILALIIDYYREKRRLKQLKAGSAQAETV
jgi:ribose transport system permease protein